MCSGGRRFRGYMGSSMVPSSRLFCIVFLDVLSRLPHMLCFVPWLSLAYRFHDFPSSYCPIYFTSPCVGHIDK